MDPERGCGAGREAASSFICRSMLQNLNQVFGKPQINPLFGTTTLQGRAEQLKASSGTFARPLPALLRNATGAPMLPHRPFSSAWRSQLPLQLQCSTTFLLAVLSPWGLPAQDKRVEGGAFEALAEPVLFPVPPKLLLGAIWGQIVSCKVTLPFKHGSSVGGLFPRATDPGYSRREEILSGLAVNLWFGA